MRPWDFDAVTVSEPLDLRVGDALGPLATVASDDSVTDIFVVADGRVGSGSFGGHLGGPNESPIGLLSIGETVPKPASALAGHAVGLPFEALVN